MTIAAQLRERVREHARAVNEAAVRNVLASLDDVVPDHDRGQYAGVPGHRPSNPKLRESRQVVTTDLGDRFVTTVTYTAPQAMFTEYGTAPHRIEPHRPPWALHFYWPKVDGWVYFDHVNHPGSHVHDGWFSRTVAGWPQAVADATVGVASAA